VVVRLRHRVPVPEPRDRLPVGADDRGVRRGGGALRYNEGVNRELLS
jgi:hypothetical protein